MRMANNNDKIIQFNISIMFRYCQDLVADV